MNSFSTKSTIANCIRFLAILYIFNSKIIDLTLTLLLITILIVKNNFTKDIYSSGVIFNYSEVNQIINILSMIFISYFLCKCFESFFL